MRKAVIVMGLPGSGKSFFAERLAKEMGAAYLSSDQIRFQTQGKGNYAFSDKLNIYKEMRRRAVSLLKDRDVVVDGTFHLQVFRDVFLDWPKGLEVKAYWFLVYAEEQVISKRLQKPRESSEADYQVYLALKASFEEPSDRIRKLESKTGNIEDMLARAKAYLFDGNG